MNLREEPIRSRKVLNSAKGAPCSARFPGICNGNSETTVWAHLNGAAFGKGMGQKAHDVLGFHACSECHRYYDIGHGTAAWIDNETLLECVLSAVCETYVRLIRSGIVVVPVDAPKPFSERETKPRKPKADRKPVGKSRPMSTGNQQHSATTPPTKRVGYFPDEAGDILSIQEKAR